MAGTLQKLRTFSDGPHWTSVVTVDGQSYTIRLFWQPGDGFWYAHLYDEQGAKHYAGEQRVIPFTPATIGIGADLGAAVVLDIIKSLALFPLGPEWPGFPGILFAYSPVPLTGQLSDIEVFGLYYLDAEATADTLGQALEAAA